MPTRHSREGENPEWMGEGRIPPSLCVRGLGGCSDGEGMGKSWQSLPHHGNHGSTPRHSRAGGNPEGCRAIKRSHRESTFHDSPKIFLAIFPHKHQYGCIIKSEDFRQSRADECGHLSSRQATGNKRQVMRQRHIKSDYTGTRKGNPDPSRVLSNDLWRRPSTELKPVANAQRFRSKRSM